MARWGVVAGVLLLILLMPQDAAAQHRFQAANPAVRVIVPEDSGAAFVYHNLMLRPDQGVHVYRQQEGAAPERLTETPLQPVQRGFELRQRLDATYAIVQEAVRRDDPTSVLLALRRDAFTAGLLSLLYPEVADALARRYVDRTAPIGERVTYRIEVVDAFGTPVGPVLETTTTLVPARPMAPSNFKAKQQAETVLLEWSYPPIDDPVVAFHVYAQPDSAADLMQLNDLPLLRELDKTNYRFLAPPPEPGRMVQYYVVATDITGQPSDPAGPAQLRIEVMAKLAQVQGVEARALALEGPVSVSWSPVDVPGVAGYRVYRSTSATEGFSPVHDGIISPDTTAYLDLPPPGQRPYFYRVAAVDAAGKEGPISAPAIVFLRDRTPPPAPTALETTFRDDGTVQLRWQYPASPPDFWSFVILRRRLGRGAASAYDQVNREALHTPQFVDRFESGEGALEGAFYEYAVLAADSARNMSDTAFVRLQIPDRTPPVSPAFIEATGQEGMRVQVRWSATPSTDATAYVVYRLGADGTRDSLLARLPITQRFYRDEAVTVGQHYVYRVAAIDSSGNTGAPSAPAKVLLRDADPPAAVRNLQAILQPEGGVLLRWEPVRSSDLAGYRIERAEIPTGQYTLLYEAPVGELSWTDTTGTATHWYRVRAVDTSGNVSRGSRPVHSVAPKNGRYNP